MSNIIKYNPDTADSVATIKYFYAGVFENRDIEAMLLDLLSGRYFAPIWIDYVGLVKTR